MIYTTGTIAISGNNVTGTGTNFTAAGSLIRNGCTVIAMTSPAQVFQITAIGSATSLTVTPAANPAIPAGTKYAILLSDSLSVDGLAQDIAETFTMYQRYMSGFADVMNGTTDVTITINGVPVTVPGQKSLAKKGANSDITSLSGLTTALSVGQGGTGAKTKEDARTNLGLGAMATQDNAAVNITGGSATLTRLSVSNNYGEQIELKPIADNQASYIRGKTYTGDNLWFMGKGSAASLDVTLSAYPGSNSFNLLASGAATIRCSSSTYTFQTNGVATATTWQSTSDQSIKKNIKSISNPIDVLNALNGCTYLKKIDIYSAESEFIEESGLIAQDILKVIPSAVSDMGPGFDKDGNEVESVLCVNYSAIIPYLVEAIKQLNAEIERLKSPTD
ncbi:tail fiber domain-containing protein [Enterobacter cloacae]|uniref:tail fiber domain-containing protein n=1 Tax=Enterobacter cloacae TaxID=550 RepID=UPI0032AF8817